MSESTDSVEIEYSEEDILYYLVDEDDVEVGFVIEEDGCEVECYYDDGDYEIVEEVSAADTDEDEPGYLRKIATIAGHEGAKVRDKAEVKLDVARDKAEASVKKASKAATEQARIAKEKAKEADAGFTREDVAEFTSDLNEIAKEGIDTARELKEAYDDIMGTFDFLSPKPRRGHSSGGPGMPGYRR